MSQLSHRSLKKSFKRGQGSQSHYEIRQIIVLYSVGDCWYFTFIVLMYMIGL